MPVRYTKEGRKGFDLVAFTPPKQAREVEAIKRYINDMDCVEITITYMPKLMNTTDITLCALTKETLKQCMKGIGNAILYNEYSSVGRFHYHGILSGVRPRCLSAIRKNFSRYVGRIEIKTISYFNSYLNYMTKSINDGDHATELDILILNNKL